MCSNAFCSAQWRLNVTFVEFVLIAYMRLNTSSASSLRFIAAKNLGDSGKNETKIATNRLTNVVHNKNRRQGLNSTKCNEYEKSIGMTRKAIGDIIAHDTFKPMLMNAAALGAVDDVWNSLIYEYPAEVAPATLFDREMSSN